MINADWFYYLLTTASETIIEDAFQDTFWRSSYCRTRKDSSGNIRTFQWEHHEYEVGISQKTYPFQFAYLVIIFKFLALAMIECKKAQINQLNQALFQQHFNGQHWGCWNFSRSDWADAENNLNVQFLDNPPWTDADNLDRIPTSISGWIPPDR